MLIEACLIQEDLKYLQRCILNTVRAICENSEGLKAANYIHKKLHIDVWLGCEYASDWQEL